MMHNLLPIFPGCLTTLNKRTQCFFGSFRLIGCVAKVSRLGEPYWSIKVADISGVREVLLFDEAPRWDTFIMNGVITMELSMRPQAGFIVAKKPELLRLSNAMMEPALFWKALPVNWCLSEWVVERFLTMLMGIQSEMLLAFITRVFWQSEVLQAFLSAPASLNYHHNYQGGLLEHSVETAEIVASLPLCNEFDRDVLITAALLHDIGKTKTLASNMRRSQLGKLVDHDEMTLEVCSDALRWLDNEHADTAILLRHIWTCSSPGARYGYKAETYLAPALQLADQMSSKMARSA
ncbi:HDIG domain-containing protein [Alkalimonas sp. MEB108]|uniref:HDIG domain-containing protein n=1 Tax=Alkalimonas cellulosilytica TaxID=3058395 RepID=A0ABU7JB88_9GAMM|nr:HD domain-containing protein [Alkalimonas sp. MEB108]MEE2003262.1 HDIG domain-containing protein [Alkalimonas sp. MEB108]